MVFIKPEDLNGENADPALLRYRNKTPKRTLKFSDGVMDEYSSEEEDGEGAHDAPDSSSIVDPSKLAWGPWMVYKTWAAGTSTLSFVDYIGEFLASFFGITTPRYYFELEEYKRRQEADENEAEKAKGWSTTNSELVNQQV